MLTNVFHNKSLKSNTELIVYATDFKILLSIKIGKNLYVGFRI